MPKPYSEDELIPLSALQHLLFCERQCALIHIEQAWAENRLTVEGRHLHERVDEVGQESRGRIRTAFGLPVRSFALGISGKADAVEFHWQGEGGEDEAAIWQPYPVEYKRGKPKMDDCDVVQLCAQGLCLEEMLGGAWKGRCVTASRVVVWSCLLLTPCGPKPGRPLAGSMS